MTSGPNVARRTFSVARGRFLRPAARGRFLRPAARPHT